MHMQYFGDSYDIVKQSLIRWLEPFGRWSVHPMLTESAPEEVDAYGRFLRAHVICKEVLARGVDRECYLSCGAKCGNLFLDPDTGLRLQKTCRRAPKYLFKHELVRLSEQRPCALTLVFDQSVPRGKQNARICMRRKLAELQANGIHCFSYVSHAGFILGGRDERLVRRAFSRVISESKLPEACFLCGWTPTSESGC
jgi:hypothetical protein